MTRIFLLSIALLTGITSFAQDSRETFEQYRKRRQQEFNYYRDARLREFDEYRRKRNEEFAKMLAQPWEKAEPQPVEPMPDVKPIPPVTIPEEDRQVVVKPNPIPFDGVITIKKPKEQPKPIVPIEELEPIRPTTPTIPFKIYGTPVKVRFDKNNSFRLASSKETDVAKAWLQLSGDEYTNLIHDCLNIRENLNLCDWAYLQMLEQMSNAVCGKGSNESVLLMAYVYSQSGYQMRLGDKDGRLFMLFSSEYIICNWTYFIIDNIKFYAYNSKDGGIAHLQSAQFPNEQPLSLLFDKTPKFILATTSPTTHQSRKYPEMKATITANKNMLDFYASYPCSRIGNNMVMQWGNYANAPMPQNIANQLYPQLQRAIEGCDQLTAVNKILDLVQTGFEYRTDEKVWGVERAFFPEETLHYPYCDCEDRGILFARLVRDLIGLNCLLVYYPMHIAAAVEFTQVQPKGDYFEYNGRKYFVADPTIIGRGAPVGHTMINKDNNTAKLLLLD